MRFTILFSIIETIKQVQICSPRAKRYNTVFLGSQQLSLVDYFCRLMLLLNYSNLNEVSLDSYCNVESKAPKVSPTYES